MEMLPLRNFHFGSTMFDCFFFNIPGANLTHFNHNKIAFPIYYLIVINVKQRGAAPARYITGSKVLSIHSAIF